MKMSLMAARGHRPSFESRTIQAPGMLRHGPFPESGPAGNRSLEPLAPPEYLKNKIAVQAADMERIAIENRRLADTHRALKHELFVTQQESQRLHEHIGADRAEGEARIRGFLEKIGKLEDEIRAGENLKAELQQAHLEAQNLIAARQEMTAEFEHVTEELERVNVDVKKLPEMHAELDDLRKEHQKLRVAFEYEKGSNMEQVERLQAMEKNLISMARELEKLRADVTNAEKRSNTPNPLSGSYGSPDPRYPPTSQVGTYPDRGYNQVVDGYGDTAYGRVGGYADGGGYSLGGPTSYQTAYSRLQADGMHQAMSSYGYDATRGASSSSRR